MTDIFDVIPTNGLCKRCGKTTKLGMIEARQVWDNDTEGEYAGPYEIMPRGYCIPCSKIVALEYRRDYEARQQERRRLATMTPEQLVEELSRCPRCHAKAHAFNHVSDPAGPQDGAYGTCGECRIYWPVSTDWIDEENMVREACREVTKIILETSELVDPPEVVLSMNRHYGRTLPGALS